MLRAAKPKATPVFFSLVVWGDTHIGMFVEFCLPSLLAPGNIPALAYRAGSRFILHTQRRDFPALEQSAAFQLLKATIDVDVRFMEVGEAAAHEAMTRCHCEAMGLGDEAGVPVIFLSPDTIWADGSMAAVDRILRAGKRVIFLTPCMRFLKEDAMPELRALLGGRSVLKIDGRSLNAIAFRFLHPMIDEYCFEPGRGHKLLPMMLCWPAPGGLLVHAFHQHPLMVWSTRPFADLSRTIDADLVDQACPDQRHHHVVQDSDEMTAIEMTSRDYMMGGLFAKGDAKSVTRWALVGANRTHWRLFKWGVRVHAGPMDAAAWVPIERRAAAIVGRITPPEWRLGIMIACATRYEAAQPAREWIYRRRTAISFFLRERWFRSRIAISLFMRDWWERRRFEIINRVFRAGERTAFSGRASPAPLTEWCFRRKHAASFFVRDWRDRRRFELANRIRHRYRAWRCAIARRMHDLASPRA